MARRRRRKRRQRIFIKLFIIILILGAVVAGIFAYRDMNKKRIKSEVVIEAGSVLVDVDEFLLSPEDRVYILAHRHKKI